MAEKSKMIFLVCCRQDAVRTICAELNKRDVFAATIVQTQHFQVVVNQFIPEWEDLDHWESVIRRLDGVKQVARATFR